MAHNDSSKAGLIPILNARLADMIDLQYQAKQAHWNVTGREFFALHEFFDEVASELRTHVDDIAERVAQLGGKVEGTIRMVSAHSLLAEYPRDAAGGGAHADALAAALATAAASMNEAIDHSESLGDHVTSDILVSAARAIDKLLWMVRAHGTAQAPRPEHTPVQRTPETARTRH
jgi:starvation-inducible DNA-binding protein